MENRTAIVFRENRAMEIQTSLARDLGGWHISIVHRKACTAHLRERYVPEVVNEVLIFAPNAGALIIYQEELTSELVAKIFNRFREERPLIPILLVRRNTGRGQSLNWAWNMPPSRVIDFTTRTRVLVESLNKLLEEASAHQSA